MPKNSSSPDRDGPSFWDRYVTMPIPQFLTAAGIGRTFLYRLINEGKVETVLVGRRRLIVVASWKRLIERSRAPGGKGGTQP